MSKFRRVLRALRHDRRAVTALEYSIIASALAFTLVAIFASLGTTLGQAIVSVSSKI